MRYQTCNPGQDCDGSETATLVPSPSLASHNAANGSGTAYSGEPKHQRNESEATAVSGANGHGNALGGELQNTNQGNHVTLAPPTTQQSPLDSV
jgi:hypothetical protein